MCKLYTPRHRSICTGIAFLPTPGNKVKRAVSGREQLSLCTFPLHLDHIPPTPSLFALHLSHALSHDLSLYPGACVSRFVCIPLKGLGALGRAQAVAAIQKCIAKIPPIEGELLSLPLMHRQISFREVTRKRNFDG